jgi:hypothetical protein
MYNPFPSMVMKEVVTGIRRSIADYEREVVMIYNNPLCHDVIVGQGGFFPIRKYPAEWGNEMFVYSSLPRARSRLATA